MLATIVTILSAVAPDEHTTFSLVLSRQRPNALSEAVAAVSEPESARFRKYLDDSEIATLLAPTGLSTVESWIKRTVPGARGREGARGGARGREGARGAFCAT